MLKMKNIILCFYLLLIISGVQAQAFEWAKSLGSSNNDHAYSISVDDSGNVYTTGYYQETVDFDPGIGVANLSAVDDKDIFILKMDASGNFIWAKSIGGISDDIGMSITVDDSSNTYTIGDFYGTVDFNPGTGIANITSSGGRDIFVLKLSSSGNFIWAKSIGGNSSEYAQSICLDSLGNVYTTGSFNGTADFNPGSGTYNLSSAGKKDIFIQKMDSSGNFIWAKSFGGAEDDFANSIFVDNSGNVLTTGGFRAVADFDPGTGVYNLTSENYSDIFIQKLAPSGNFIWAKSFGGASSEYGNSICLDATGNVYTTGFFGNTVDFDPGTGIYNLSTTSPGYFKDVFVQKLNASGNFIWAKSFGGIEDDFGNSINLDADGNVYTTGVFKRLVDFNLGAGINHYFSKGKNDVFVQ